MARKMKSHTLKVTRNADGTLTLGDPQFAQPAPTPDPTKFTVAHGNDNPLYNLVQKNLLQAIPPPNAGANLTMTLQSALGSPYRNDTRWRSLRSHMSEGASSRRGLRADPCSATRPRIHPEEPLGTSR